MTVERGPAAQLVARGPRLLEEVAHGAQPLLRWYAPTDAAIVVGRGQPPLPSPPLPVHQRVSGGGAVLVDEDLLWLDVAVPAGHPWLGSGLHDVFDLVGLAWAAALREVGVDVTTHPGPNTARRRGTPREQLLAAICYATLGRGEVLAHGRKLVGLSQRRTRDGALVQCGLLMRWKPEPLLQALGAPTNDPEVANAAVGVHDLLPQVHEDRIAAAVEAVLLAD